MYIARYRLTLHIRKEIFILHYNGETCKVKTKTNAQGKSYSMNK